MDNKEFDEIIKKKLESLGSSGGGDHWDEFKEMWNAEQDLSSEEEQMADDVFDNSIKDQFENLRMPFNSNHWIRLKEQLEAEALFRKRLYVAKAVEIIMLALLVISIINIWPIQKEIYEIPVYDMPMAASIAVEKSTAENYEKNVNKEKNKTKVVSNIQSNLVIKNLPESLTANSIRPTIKKFSPLNFDESGFITLQETQVESESILYDTEDAKETKKQRGVLDLQTIHKKESSLEIPFRPIGYPDISLPKPEVIKEDTYLNVSIGPKVNVINSPFDPVFDIDPYNIFNTNFSITATMDRTMGPIDLYAGLGYTNTSYDPLFIQDSYEEFQNEFEASLENIQFKTFEIPIGAKFNMVNTNEFGFYVRTGLNLHLIAQAQYDIKHERTGSRNGPKLDPKHTSSNSRLSQKNFSDGILQGGSLSDNLYATATLGLGMNKTLGSRYGIFLEPKYNHFISAKGIGPNEDKIHAFSMDLGMRFLLN